MASRQLLREHPVQNLRVQINIRCYNKMLNTKLLNNSLAWTSFSHTCVLQSAKRLKKQFPKKKTIQNYNKQCLCMEITTELKYMANYTRYNLNTFRHLWNNNLNINLKHKRECIKLLSCNVMLNLYN